MLLQMYMQKFQLKGERFGGFSGRGRGGFSGRGGRGGFGGFNRPGDTCFKCGGTGHWASNCQGKGEDLCYRMQAVDQSVMAESELVPVLT